MVITMMTTTAMICMTKRKTLNKKMNKDNCQLVTLRKFLESTAKSSEDPSQRSLNDFHSIPMAW
jgi:hypothetical protein